jgi:hypothetical protein
MTDFIDLMDVVEIAPQRKIVTIASLEASEVGASPGFCAQAHAEHQRDGYKVNAKMSHDNKSTAR